MNNTVLSSLFLRLSLLTLLLSCVSISCNETLPEYRDPLDVLSAHVRGRYILVVSDNSLKVDLLVVNTFDETFEAKAILAGSGTITMKRKPNIRKTFSLTAANWTNGKYNPTTGILRMDPGDTLRLVYSWNFIDDNGTDVRASEFYYVPDASCPGRRIAARESFIFQARMKIFDRIPEVVAEPYEFYLCHVNFWIRGGDCPPIQEDRPETYCPKVVPFPSSVNGRSIE